MAEKLAPEIGTGKGCLQRIFEKLYEERSAQAAAGESTADPKAEGVHEVATGYGRVAEPCFLTGGLCDNAYVVERLFAALGSQVATCPEARYAGAFGAALMASEL